MSPGHLHGDSRHSTPGIHCWMRVRRRCGRSGRARPRGRSATARPFALDSRFHRPASPGRAGPRRQRRRVARGSGRGRSEAVATAHADEAVTVLREELLGALLARLVDRGRGSAPAALRPHRVRERKLPGTAGHAPAGPPSANRVDDERGSRNVPFPRCWHPGPEAAGSCLRGPSSANVERGPADVTLRRLEAAPGWAL
ncbi:MAG: hypothetical protein HW416_3534, partial [Chloroflexi bacterium]|nr:hypothetical protein [Chloroflexota bacterium]